MDVPALVTVTSNTGNAVASSRAAELGCLLSFAFIDSCCNLIVLLSSLPFSGLGQQWWLQQAVVAQLGCAMLLAKQVHWFY